MTSIGLETATSNGEPVAAGTLSVLSQEKQSEVGGPGVPYLIRKCSSRRMSFGRWQLRPSTATYFGSAPSMLPLTVKWC